MATLGLAVAATVVAVGAGVALILGRGWLDQRIFWGVGLVAASLVVLWWRPGGWAGAAWASVLLAAGGVVVATDLSRLPGSDFDPRVLADDLPPVAVYVAAIGLGLASAACGVVAALRARARPVGSRRQVARVAGVGGVAAAVIVAAVVPVGTAIRSAADRRAEAADLTLRSSAPVERRADAPGPALPSRRAWSVEGPPYRDGSVAVPGWDVILVVSSLRPFSLTAVTTSDGDELWTYRRDGAGGVDVTVDPEAGRILLVEGDAAVVLDLVDGSEVATRRLPHPEECQEAGGPDVSAWTARACDDRDGDRWVALIEVSTGMSRAVTEPLAPDGEVRESLAADGYCGTTLVPGAAPMVVRADDCGPPQIVAYEPNAGRFGTPATLELPAAWNGARGPLRAYSVELESGPIATDDVVVLHLSWYLDDEDTNATPVPEDARSMSEAVALNRDGDVLWRRPETSAVLAATEQGVLVRTPDQLELLALSDATVLAEDPQAGADDGNTTTERVTTSDGERLYTLYDLGLAGTNLTVRDLQDLTVREVRGDIAPAATTHMHATNGRLIFQTDEFPETDDATLVAYQDPRPR